MGTIQSKPIIDPKIDHIQGDLNAPIILLEYGDYECPYCQDAYGVIKSLQNHFGPQLCFVFRNFPLSEIHLHAELAAEAAEAANAQNKFWEMYDCLFENQNSLEKPALIKLAKKIGLKHKQFKKDLESGAYQSRVERDLLLGLKEDVNGTPTFFINGILYNGSYKLLDQALQVVLNTLF